MKLSLLESLVLAEARDPTKKYTEKKVKGVIEKVIVQLEASESASMTKLAQRYHRLDLAIKRMKEKQTELNAQVKEKMEPLFDAEDIIYTRIVETASFTLQLSKRTPAHTKVEFDYEAIANELLKMLPDELEAQANKMIALYTKLIPVEPKSPALTMKQKKGKDAPPTLDEGLTEGVLDFAKRALAAINSMIKGLTRWAVSYDRKLARLKKEAGFA